jgi:hypothetical protein
MIFANGGELYFCSTIFEIVLEFIISKFSIKIVFSKKFILLSFSKIFKDILKLQVPYLI